MDHQLKLYFSPSVQCLAREMSSASFLQMNQSIGRTISRKLTSLKTEDSKLLVTYDVILCKERIILESVKSLYFHKYELKRIVAYISYIRWERTIEQNSSIRCMVSNFTWAVLYWFGWNKSETGFTPDSCQDVYELHVLTWCILDSAQSLERHGLAVYTCPKTCTH